MKYRKGICDIMSNARGKEYLTAEQAYSISQQSPNIEKILKYIYELATQGYQEAWYKIGHRETLGRFSYEYLERIGDTLSELGYTVDPEKWIYQTDGTVLIIEWRDPQMTKGECEID